jgi:hypothetical protein
MFTRSTALIVAALLLAGVSTTGAQQDGSPSEHVVEAQKFLLKDENGKVRAELGFRRGGPHIDLLNLDGSVGVSLNLEDNGRGLAISGPNGQEQLVMGKASGQVYAITIKSEDGSQLLSVPGTTAQASDGSVGGARSTWPIALAIIIAGAFIAGGVFLGITRKRTTATGT